MRSDVSFHSTLMVVLILCDGKTWFAPACLPPPNSACTGAARVRFL